MERDLAGIDRVQEGDSTAQVPVGKQAFVLDRTENPHPVMLQGAKAARDAGGAYWQGYMRAMADATGCDPSDLEAWMDRAG